MARIDLVVMGASAGGVEALCAVLAQLPADFGAAVLIVMHIGEESILPTILGRYGKLPCNFVMDHPAMRRGHVYVSPPNYHMCVTGRKLALSQGPKENLRRPSVDPLFRSAAHLYGDRVVGVILTGALGDGAIGLSVIKDKGGITIVQDPKEALHSSMPTEAIRRTKVDYRLSVKRIGAVLVKLVGSRKGGFLLTPIQRRVERRRAKG